MDGEAILKLASYAARNVHCRFSLCWTPEDWQDATQEAAAGICRALKSLPSDLHNERAYLKRAGEQGATRFAFRSSAPWGVLSSDMRDDLRQEDFDADQSDSHADEGEPVIGSSRGWQTPLEDEDMPRLRAILSTVPRKDCARGGPKTRDQLAVARDLVILRSLSRGMTHQEIADEIGDHKRNVHSYLTRIRSRLAALAAQHAA